MKEPENKMTVFGRLPKFKIYFFLTILVFISHPIQAKEILMETPDFTTTVVVDQSPKEVFNAITNVRAWWSEEIEGGTSKLHDEFVYHYEDAHKCKIKLIEVIPNEKVVWLVADNYFKFTKDKSEWKGTKIIFEIAQKNKKTEMRFTHQGLVPEYECYAICTNAWTFYIQTSLRSLITTGKGQPNPKGGRNDFQEGVSQQLEEQAYHISFTTDAAPHEAFNAINNVTQWWTENLEGHSQKLNDEFSVRFGDVHYSKHRLVEVIPDKKIVWLVADSRLNFLKDKSEWTNTKIVFEIRTQNNRTEVHFTHVGLVPEVECYNACTNAWGQYIQQSLYSLITTGKGRPALKENQTEISK